MKGVPRALHSPRYASRWVLPRTGLAWRAASKQAGKQAALAGRRQRHRHRHRPQAPTAGGSRKRRRAGWRLEGLGVGGRGSECQRGQLPRPELTPRTAPPRHHRAVVAGAPCLPTAQPSPAQTGAAACKCSGGGGVGRLISRRVVECWSGRVAGLARPSVRRPPARTSRLPGTDARLSFSSRSRLDAEERKLGMLCASARLHGSVCVGAKWKWKCEPRFRLTVRYVPLPPGAPPTSQGAGRLRIGRRAPL